MIGIRYNSNGDIIDNINHIKGIGKEYNIYNTIIFEGEYLNGLRNGKGKEYDLEEKLIFEGEYLNDRKWTGKGYDPLNNIVYELKEGKGIIKEYNVNDSKLIFEGEYLNNNKNGKGKEYCFGQLIYEGEYLNGKRNGKGKEYWNEQLIFEGEYLYDFKIRGKFYLNKSLEFEGEFLFNKKWNGKGYDKKGNIIYELKNGNGKVKEYNWNDKLLFEGEYLNGKKNGKGKEYDYAGKLIFKGQYLNGKKIE